MSRAVATSVPIYRISVGDSGERHWRVKSHRATDATADAPYQHYGDSTADDPAGWTMGWEYYTQLTDHGGGGQQAQNTLLQR